MIRSAILLATVLLCSAFLAHHNTNSGSFTQPEVVLNQDLVALIASMDSGDWKQIPGSRSYPTVHTTGWTADGAAWWKVVVDRPSSVRINNVGTTLNDVGDDNSDPGAGNFSYHPATSRLYLGTNPVGQSVHEGGPFLLVEDETYFLARDGGNGFWDDSGSRSVMRAWCSSALNQVTRKWYFTCGGHSDYGGNEVYEYAFDAGKWTRLTDPSPLTVALGSYYRPVDPAPPAFHTYYSMNLNAQDNSLWITAAEAMYCGGSGCIIPVVPDAPVWRFDVATKTWQKFTSTDPKYQGSSTPLNGSDLMLTISRLPTDQYATIWEPNGDYTPMNAGAKLPGAWNNSPQVFQFPSTAPVAFADHVIAVNSSGLREYSIDAGAATLTQESTRAVSSIGFNTSTSGYAFNPVDDLVYIWDGGRAVYTWTPQTDTWATLTNAASAEAPTIGADGSAGVYRKWFYLDDYGVFVGVQSTAEGGIWMWKP